MERDDRMDRVSDPASDATFEGRGDIFIGVKGGDPGAWV